jgi:hypothetical protein
VLSFAVQEREKVLTGYRLKIIIGAASDVRNTGWSSAPCKCEDKQIYKIVLYIVKLKMLIFSQSERWVRHA